MVLLYSTITGDHFPNVLENFRLYLIMIIARQNRQIFFAYR